MNAHPFPITIRIAQLAEGPPIPARAGGLRGPQAIQPRVSTLGASLPSHRFAVRSKVRAVRPIPVRPAAAQSALGEEESKTDKQT
jgi:hypothetical protein